MTAKARSIATAIKTAINAATLSHSVTAVTAFLPLLALEDAGSLYCCVTWDGWTRETIANGTTYSDYAIEVHVRKRVTDPATDSEYAALADFCGEIEDLLIGTTLATDAMVWQVDTRIDKEMAMTHGYWNAILTFTCRVIA